MTNTSFAFTNFAFKMHYMGPWAAPGGGRGDLVPQSEIIPSQDPPKVDRNGVAYEVDGVGY